MYIKAKYIHCKGIEALFSQPLAVLYKGCCSALIRSVKIIVWITVIRKVAIRTKRKFPMPVVS